MWIVSHEEIAAGSKFAAWVQRTLGHVVANTEGGRKVIGRWNRPTDFDHLVGDLLDMSRPGAAACRSSRRSERAKGAGRRPVSPFRRGAGLVRAITRRSQGPAKRMLPYWEGARRACGGRFEQTEVVRKSFWVASPSPRIRGSTTQRLRTCPQRASSGRLEVAWKSLQRYRGRLEVTRLRG